MEASPGSTSSGLIDRARNEDEKSWNEMVNLYGPVVFSWVRRAGVPQADASDVVQNVFVAIIRGLREFDHQSFRGWLRILTRNKISDYFRKYSKEPSARGGSSLVALLHQFPDFEFNQKEASCEQVFGGMSAEQSTEFQDIVQNVRERTSTRCWQVFWSVTVEHRAPEDVSEELSMKIGTVYQCVSRTLIRLRKALKEAGD